MRDGKLITLTNHVAIPAGQKAQYPLDRLPFYFPIPPVGDITRSFSASHSETQVVRRGAVSQFGGPELEEISWDSEFLIPDWYSGNTVDSWDYFPSYFIPPPAGFKHYGANAAYALLHDIAEQGLVVVLTVQDRNTGAIEIQMPVTIRSISMKETGGEPDTRFYSIKFVQYRFLTIALTPRSGEGAGGGIGRPAPGRYISNPYTMRSAMGVQSLAMLAYRDRSQWRKIVMANGGPSPMFTRGARWAPERRDGPYLLPKGSTFIIPEIDLSGINVNRPIM